MVLVSRRLCTYLLTASIIFPSLSGCGATEEFVHRQAISRVLSEYQRISESEGSTRQKVARLKEISLTSCPRDFRLAFAKHLQALENLAAFEEEIGTAVGWGLLIGTAELLLGVPGLITGPGALQYYERYQEIAAQIRSTWEEVTVTAASYGVG